MNTDEFTVPARVSYREGMLLDATDFTAEQNYHRLRLGEVLARLHGSGTVAGLKVGGFRKDDRLPDGTTAGEDRIQVQPGLAVDRRGRLIEVTSARCVRLDPWFKAVAAAGVRTLRPFAPNANERWLVADVFLRYLEAPEGLRPGFPEADEDATDAIVAARARDSFELLLAPRSSEPPGTPPPLPKKPFQPPPATRTDLLQAIYAAYTPAEPLEYPAAPPDATPTGTPAAKLQEKSAVFLSRVLVRLTDAPAGSLARHDGGDFRIDDSARLVLPAAELLLGLTSLA